MSSPDLPSPGLTSNFQSIGENLMDQRPTFETTVRDVLYALISKTAKQGTVFEILGGRFEVISEDPYKFRITYPSGKEYMATVPSGDWPAFQSGNVDAFTDIFTMP
jgi:hypothetical protein